MIFQRLISSAISIALATSDGGLITDQPYADPDAGVYQVESAQIPHDGGTLGPGWYLTEARISKVGEHLASCQEHDSKARPNLIDGKTILIVSTIALMLGAGAALYIERKLVHP